MRELGNMLTLARRARRGGGGIDSLKRTPGLRAATQTHLNLLYFVYAQNVHQRAVSVV